MSGTRIPKLDMALSSLVEDLYLRGLDKDVSVVVWGEFGRTPKINKNAGRDHWPPVNFALLAGGGMRTGQVIGSTDKQAAYVKDRPVSFQNVFATLYHNLGIDPGTAVADRSGRPMYLARRAPADPRIGLTGRRERQPASDCADEGMPVRRCRAHPVFSATSIPGSQQPLRSSQDNRPSARPRAIP